MTVDLQSPKILHQIIQDASHAIEKARREEPTALQEISDSTEGDPFRVMIATVLSHRTKDSVTARASTLLFAKYAGPKQLARSDTRTVSRLIRPVGFYKTKAKTIKRIAKIILENYDAKFTEELDQLRERP